VSKEKERGKERDRRELGSRERNGAFINRSRLLDCLSIVFSTSRRDYLAAISERERKRERERFRLRSFLLPAENRRTSWINRQNGNRLALAAAVWYGPPASTRRKVTTCGEGLLHKRRRENHGEREEDQNGETATAAAISATFLVRVAPPFPPKVHNSAYIIRTQQLTRLPLHISFTGQV